MVLHNASSVVFDMPAFFSRCFLWAGMLQVSVQAKAKLLRGWGWCSHPTQRAPFSAWVGDEM